MSETVTLTLLGFNTKTVLGTDIREKRRLQGDIIVDFQYLQGAYKKDGDKLLAGHVTIGQGVMVLN